ncbi:hypothetical protein SAMN04489761_4188 [Tenacibaculum sp. MAR_2009_124]|uniref:hypothetical protein n=1 Tax=Tenacibaculum sp. MAR_2009_124 TaxID=1250059 RepID=UPI000897DBBE|nr:hypothetical protein [Tenacibaculum sp. MAR_2009_124]SED07440.1 hypothetical protein SAMN04489761_4188 [Tenacibaculum sp. MAR_2009_124]
MIEIVNQVFEIEQKSERENFNNFKRNIRRIYHELDELGYYLKNPLGEPYTEERTDVNASLENDIHSEMQITKVLKPIIYKREDDGVFIVQKGVVIVT